MLRVRVGSVRAVAWVSGVLLEAKFASSTLSRLKGRMVESQWGKLGRNSDARWRYGSETTGHSDVSVSRRRSPRT